MIWALCLRTITPPVTPGPPATFNYDGKTDLNDLGIVLAHYNEEATSLPAQVATIAPLGAEQTTADSLQFVVAFSKNVTGVDAADFSLVCSNTTGNITAVTGYAGGYGSYAVYVVTVDNVYGNGTVQLNLIDNGTIIDEDDNYLDETGFNGDHVFAGQAYVVATPALAAPSGLTATIVDGRRATLTWQDHATNETGYVVEEWIDSDWQVVEQLGANAQSDTVYGVFRPQQAYEFRVRAFVLHGSELNSNNYEYSRPSNVAVAASGYWPEAVVSLTANVISNSVIDLYWASGGGDPTGYTVERSADGETWTLLATLPGTATYYRDSGLTDGTDYEYRVQALNDAGGSGYATVEAATYPTAPATFDAETVSGTEIDLSWSAAPYATGYTVWMEAEDADTWTLIATLDADQLSYPVTGLAAGGVAYAFRVAPTNSTAASAMAYASCATQNEPPAISSVTADDNPVTGTSTGLHVAAYDDQAESNLTYSWSVLSSPDDCGAWFSENGDNAAKDTTVTFYAAGDYTFQVTVTDGPGASVTGTVSTTVEQTTTSVVVTPGDAAVLEGDTQQFTATALDQFGDELEYQPAGFAWSASGGVGSIDNNTGLYTAPSTGKGGDSSFTVTAVDPDSGVSGSANVAFKAKGTMNEFVIGCGGTFEVPAGVDTLYFGIHDSYHWQDEWGEVSVELFWNNGDVSSCTATAACVYFALAPSGVAGPSGEDVDSCRPISVSVPAGATSVTISASGSWGWGPEDLGYICGPAGGTTLPGGGSVQEDAVYSSYLSTDYDSQDISPVTCRAGMLVGLWDHPARLLDLTVADHSNPSNSATAIDAAVRDLYVPEDATGAAQVNIAADVEPIGGLQNLHLMIQRSDGATVADQYMTQPQSYLETLTATSQDSDFVVTAWLDTNHNGQIDGGEDSETIDVHLVKPWTAVGTWTAGHAAMVQANADDVSLECLATDITGVVSDSWFLSHPADIKRGTQIDVTPLLQLLEMRLRSNVVAAANLQKFVALP